MILSARLTMFDNANLLDHAAKVDGFHSVYLHYNEILEKNLYLVTNRFEGLKDFLGVSLISNPTNSIEWTRRQTSLPIITAGQAARFGTDYDNLLAVFDADFNPRANVFLPSEAQSLISATNPCEAKILSRQFTAHRLSAEVETPSPTMLVVAQSYYHNWHSYIDGVRAPLWRANFAFQALEVPSGKHQVEIIYEDQAFRIGALVSLTALAGTLILCFWRKRAVPNL
jgi:hypothetical protein